MRNIYLFLILLVYSCNDAEPEPEPPKQLRFSTQAEIDNIEFNFPDCKILDRDVWIQGDDIANLHGFSQVTRITGGLHISTGDYLVNLEGLEGLTSIGGGLYIGTNTIHPVFNSLKGLDNLASIGTELGIIGNPELKDLKELGNLTSVSKGIEIGSNDRLKDLTGLENITYTKAGYIMIQGNDSLTSLTGLQINNADSIRLVQIIGNPLLSTCDVQCICSYLANPTGPVNIYDNASGCASHEEIEIACGDLLKLEVGKVAEFSKFINKDTKTDRKSIDKLSKLEGVEYILTAHYAVSDDFGAAFKDWSR